MLKKIIFILLIITMCVSFAACERKHISEAPTAPPTTEETKN